MVEFPLDTQCFLARCGDAVFLAFRGSQPISFLDWFYDFTINRLPDQGQPTHKTANRVPTVPPSPWARARIGNPSTAERTRDKRPVEARQAQGLDGGAGASEPLSFLTG